LILNVSDCVVIDCIVSALALLLMRLESPSTRRLAARRLRTGRFRVVLDDSSLVDLRTGAGCVWSTKKFKMAKAGLDLKPV